MTSSSIALMDSGAETPPTIVQLYPLLELFSAGDPPANTLFIMGRAPLTIEAVVEDELLLIDPPADASTRFRLEGRVAALFTTPSQAAGIPLVQTMAGGVAHLRIGEHFVDIYALAHGAVVHLPALGIVCSGQYGSNASLPQLAPGSDGSAELDALRLLARLVRQRRLQCFLPRVGAWSGESVEAMERLADDVGYLHGLRRVAPALMQQGESQANMQRIADSLLPATRRTPLCRAVHQTNLEIVRSLGTKG